MLRLIRFFILLVLKSLRYFLYPTQVQWVNDQKVKSWKDVRLVVLLNHTSLAEFIYAGVFPISYMWRHSKHLVFPIADITYDRFLFGRFLRQLAPDVPSLSRKKDQSWFRFLEALKEKSILIFAPEGRMKRRNGLDKNGKPMTTRGGICDVLQKMKAGKLVFVYSAGLHHVLAPGDRYPKIFKRIKVRMEVVDIGNYIKRFNLESGRLDKRALCKNLEERRDKFCPVL